MRILALRTGGFVLPYIHAFMVKAFRSLGAEVLERPVPATLEESKLLLRITGRQFDAGFIVDLGENETFIQNFREIQLTLKIPWIIWFVDDPDGYRFPGSCDPGWSHVFCWDQEISRRLSLGDAWKGRPVNYLPLAVCPEVFSPEGQKPNVVFPRGVFVGSTHHKNSFLESTAATIAEFEKHELRIWRIYSKDFNRHVYDLAWEYLAENSGRSLGEIQGDTLARLWVHTCVFKLGIKKRIEVASRVLEGGAIFGDGGWRGALGSRYRGTANYGRELCGIYNQSAFVLDIRQPQSRTGLTQRIFDAHSCGVPVITEWSPELEVWFDPEKEISSYRSIEEAVWKRDALLRSPEEGKRMAGKVRRRVLREHTYRNRALQVFEALESEYFLKGCRV
jgi:hypothetical protein